MTGPVDRLAILGVGLLGGSLALAVRAAGLAREIVGFGRGRENLQVALARGVVDRVTTDLADAARGAELVVLAVPVGACGPLAARAASVAAPGAIVTDVASVKGPVVAALEQAWPDAGLVVGGHPIAGSDRSGAAAATADLFAGRRCVLTPSRTTSPAALDRVRELWEAVGAVVETMDARRHDEIFAWVSHLPHAVAYALVEAIGRADPTGALAGYGGAGLRDTTRIARSDVVLWRDVLVANGPAVLTALAGFRTACDELDAALRAADAGAVERFIATARGRAPGTGAS